MCVGFLENLLIFRLWTSITFHATKTSMTLVFFSFKDFIFFLFPFARRLFYINLFGKKNISWSMLYEVKEFTRESHMNLIY